MKTLKMKNQLLSAIVGGASALLGFGLMLTGCGESGDEEEYYGVSYGEPPWSESRVECCSQLNGAYAACVEQYEKTGKCPVVQDDEKLKACCGESGSENYEVCVEDYKKTGSCQHYNEPQPTVYGPDPVSVCCQDAQNEKEYASCEKVSIAQNSTCDFKNDAGVKACCDNAEGGYYACVEDYLVIGHCVDHDDQMYADYGPIDP